MDAIARIAEPAVDETISVATIAETHYLQTTEDDYSDAVVVPAGDLEGTFKGKQQPAAAGSIPKNPTKKPPLQPFECCEGGLKYTRQDSNLQPSVPKTDALSNCATGAWLNRFSILHSQCGEELAGPVMCR